MKNIVQILLTGLVILMPALVLAASQSGTVTMEFDLSRQANNADTRLWIPYPLSDRDQLVTNIQVTGDFAESAVYSDRKYSTPMLYMRWNKGAVSRKAQFSFHVERQEVIRRDFPTTEGAWNPAEFALYLQATSLGPIDGEVKKLADKITAGKTTVLDKAKAIYDWTCENMHREPDTVGCGLGDVDRLLRTPGGKCTDIHSVFVALCRAAGVPASEIFGIRLGKEPMVDITGWQHCWAEFYLPGYDWVPVDPADVRKMMLTQNLKIDDAKTKEYRTYFWGGWDQYRVKLASGRDIMLNPAQNGPPLNTFGYPYAEIDAKVLDFYDPTKFSYKITYRQ